MSRSVSGRPRRTICARRLLPVRSSRVSHYLPTLEPWSVNRSPARISIPALTPSQKPARVVLHPHRAVATWDPSVSRGHRLTTAASRTAEPHQQVIQPTDTTARPEVASRLLRGLFCRTHGRQPQTALRAEAFSGCLQSLRLEGPRPPRFRSGGQVHLTHHRHPRRAVWYTGAP
jgi:hypothetical protein